MASIFPPYEFALPLRQSHIHLQPHIRVRDQSLRQRMTKPCTPFQNNTATSLPAESFRRTNPLPESVVLLFILCSNPLEPPSMEQWYFILIPLFLAGSIFAFVAYGVANRLESLLKSFPPNDLAFRLHQLEQK